MLKEYFYVNSILYHDYVLLYLNEDQIEINLKEIRNFLVIHLIMLLYLHLVNVMVLKMNVDLIMDDQMNEDVIEKQNVFVYFEMNVVNEKKFLEHLELILFHL